MCFFFKNPLNSCRTKLELLNKSSIGATTCQGPTPYQMLFLTFFVSLLITASHQYSTLPIEKQMLREARSFKVTQQVATLGFVSGLTKPKTCALNNRKHL